MNDFFSLLIRITVRAVLLVMGLVFAFSLLCVAAVLGVVWWLRLLWARVTGRPVKAWVFRVDPRAGWHRFSRARGNGWAGSPASGGSARAAEDQKRPLTAGQDWRDARGSDVTDVDPK